MDKYTYRKIKNTCDAVRKAVEQLRGLSREKYDESIIGLIWEIGYNIENVNLELLDSKTVNFCNLNDLEKYILDYDNKEESVRQYNLWLGKILELLEKRYHAENTLDECFIKMMDYVGAVDADMMVKKTKKCLFNLENNIIEKLCAYYQTFHYMWGTLDVSNDKYDVIRNRVTALKKHREDFVWLYDRLGDWRSRLVLYNMLHCWITFDLNDIRGMKEGNFRDYFDLDLVRCDDQEVVVDLGAWIGDSALDYIHTYGKYKKIYCYEIDACSMETMKKNLERYPDIVYRNKAAGSRNGISYINIMSSDSSGNRITNCSTGEEIEVVSLDCDIDERINLIKMDIEGSEQDALKGCRRHIQEEKPKLLISVYHNNEDIWKIPRMILDMNPNYRLYLRSNGIQWGPAEIVLFAI